MADQDIRLVGNLVGYIDYFLVGLPHVYFFVEGGMSVAKLDGGSRFNQSISV